jgi:hypothetical protein
MKNLKNDQKVEAANKVLAFAKELGFHDAFISYEDEDESFYEDVEAIAADRDEGDETLVKIHLTLDEDLQVEINEENEIVYK